MKTLVSKLKYVLHIDLYLNTATKIIQIFVFLSLCAVHAYLRRLFAPRWGGGTTGGGQRGRAGLWWALFTGGGHFVEAVLPGRVGLHAAGG